MAIELPRIPTRMRCTPRGSKLLQRLHDVEITANLAYCLIHCALAVDQGVVEIEEDDHGGCG
jgi:hypothetical protein